MSDDRRKYDIELKQAIQEVKEETNRIWVLLNGNGKEGLVAKINRHDLFLTSMQGYMRTTATALIVGIVGVVIGYLIVRLNIPHA